MTKFDDSYKKRVITALSNKEPDKVPIFELYMNDISIINIAKFLDADGKIQKLEKSNYDKIGNFKVLDLYCFIVEKLLLDSTTTNFSLGSESIDKKHNRDKYGVVYSNSPYGLDPLPIQGPIKDKFDLANYDILSRLKMEDFSGVMHVIDKIGPGKAHFLIVPDQFKLSWYLMGSLQNLLINYIANPKLIHDLNKMLTEYNMAVIEIAHKIGIDVIILNGDLAGELNTIISPEHYREYLKPYHNILVEYTHKKGMKIVKHSDGDVWPILDDFIEVGFDGLHPIQPQCMDIEEVKKYLSGRLCILGNIDCRTLLPKGSENDVKEEVIKTIKEAAKGGGYIISSSNSIHPECKPENYIALVEATHKYGLY